MPPRRKTTGSGPFQGRKPSIHPSGKPAGRTGPRRRRRRRPSAIKRPMGSWTGRPMASLSPSGVLKGLPPLGELGYGPKDQRLLGIAVMASASLHRREPEIHREGKAACRGEPEADWNKSRPLAARPGGSRPGAGPASMPMGIGHAHEKLRERLKPLGGRIPPDALENSRPGDGRPTAGGGIMIGPPDAIARHEVQKRTWTSPEPRIDGESSRFRFQSKCCNEMNLLKKICSTGDGNACSANK
jgi:hypothetical protein